MLKLGTYQPKERIATDHFVIRKLEARDAKIDYEAVMSSIETIKKQRGGTWPTEDLTFEDDVIDLGWHQREFESGGSFAYAVTNIEDTEELGCVYFYPPGHPMNSTGANYPEGTDVCVNLWVTQKAFDNGLYDKLYVFVEGWLRQWPFEKPLITNPLKPQAS